jgi:outer membrane protein OmpA-like peptidoglycan-associated protein
MKVSVTVAAMILVSALQAQSSFTVYFGFDKHHLTGTARSGIDSFIFENKERLYSLLISLNGHCDKKGSDAYNDRLSVQRVLAVKRYLIGSGLKRSAIISQTGHGKKELINENQTEEERLLNRRVVISYTNVVETSLPGVISLKEKLADTALIIGSNIVLKNINFEGGTHQFLPQSKSSLNELLEAMQANPRLVIQVEGHICCEEYPDDGLDLETGLTNLSEARAFAVKEYLTNNNIEAGRITYKGFGHSRPIFPYPEKTEAERIQNRRVEIKIISR